MPTPMSEAQVLGAEIERVLPDVPVSFDRDSTFYSKIEKRPVEVMGGRDMRCPIEIAPGGYTRGFNSDGGDMGVGSGPTYDKAVINTIDMLHAVEWTTKSQWVTDDRRKAVINNFRRLLAKQMSQFRRDVDALISVGDGNATLGTVGTYTSQGLSTVLDEVLMNTDGFGAHNVRQGLRVDFWSANWATKRAGGPVEITYWDVKNKIIGFTAGAVTPVNTDHVVMEGFPGTPPIGIFGVAYHDNASSTGTWEGFDRSVTPQIVANNVNANSNPLALPFPRLALNLIGDRLGIKERGQRTEAWTHPAQQASYEELGTGYIQIHKEAKEEALDLYFNENMRLAGAPLKISYAWDRTRIDFIDFDLWGRAELHKAGFYEVDGKRIFEMRGGSGGLAASMIFYLCASFNIFVKLPAGCSYISSLTVPSGY
jgi:hypothetical protein